MVVSDEPTYLSEVSEFIQSSLGTPTSLLAAFAALFTDPSSYTSTKGQPPGPLADFVHELALTNRSLKAHLQDPDTPISRSLIDGKWCPVWRNARDSQHAIVSGRYDVCISFAGSDRAIASEIATRIESNERRRKVFYDEFERINLWGEELFNYLYRIYSQESKFCLILFSHAYLQRAWTRHELRAVQTRVLHERESYVLPVEIDKGAVPDVFKGISYWPFVKGDEQRIADAAEGKVNEYIGKYYSSLEELTHQIGQNRAAIAVLGGFRGSIHEHVTNGDSAGAEVLTILALIAAADAGNVRPSIRALIDMVLFDEGPVGDYFENDVAGLFDRAGVGRSFDPQNPLYLVGDGWDDHFRSYRERWDDPEPDDDPDDKIDE
jgi:hypothetical protein